MKVHGHDPNRIERNRAESAYAVENSAAKPESKPKAENLNAADSASVSENAKLLARARVELQASQDEARAARVAAIKQQVENGTYEIPLDALAEKLAGEVGPEMLADD